MTAANRETHGFQAEVQKLLHLMIHSLYSNREIFLRELVSNASDAADRLRFEAIATPALLENEPDLKIRVECDPEARTIAVVDNGIGMSRDEAVAQLGTIARSGTAEFFGRLSGEQRADAQLIGQFGVGFYSAFIVADRVEVRTRRAGSPATEGVRWESDGQGEYLVETVEIGDRGTRVTLHLREDALEFTDELRVRELIRKYSDHIAFPVLLATRGKDGEMREEAANTAKALWTRPRAEVTEDEYREFYKHISHDFSDPLCWSHNRVEGRREYTSLIYMPARAPWDLWNRDARRGLKLYVRRVFIMDDAEQFLPMYLRFIRGVVDSDDLPLNVSRELLQQDSAVEAMRSALSRRVLDMLDRLAADEPDKYATFWKEFGRVLKEGPAEDPANRDRIARLLRFSSTHTDSDAQDQSLADYVARKQEGQERIWYITAESPGAARSSPHLEIFRKRGIEVLLLTDPVDEWMVGHQGSFEGLEFRDVRRGALELGEDGEAAPAVSGESDEFIRRMKERLGTEIEDVRATARLTDSPACLALGEQDVGEQLRRLMKAAGQPLPKSRPVLELNLDHPLVKRLSAEQDDTRFGDLAGLLLDQAKLAEGRQLPEPGEFVRRLNRILLDLSA